VKGALIAGSGGQGILFLGKLLAYGAMLEGKNVTWFPSYGAEMRGGTANCTVIISDNLIGSPIVSEPDLIVVMNEASKNKFEGRLKKGGLLLVDSSLSDLTSKRKDIRIVGVPASDVAASIGDAKYANMVLMGALISEEDLVGKEYIFEALEQLTPPHRKRGIEINKEAIGKGMAFNGDKKS
jgi:2-oxoglutarate ferredoxin oxidoreductase subunit gamma